ncbi:MAG: DNA repair protein RecN [Clostridia bacterium]|nr:DNA repair protein RecN [Clostridia bacterium]
MLRRLSVRDFALFSSAEFLPEEGFVALTGQTGAGKSLVVDALAFVTGSRKGREYVRQGSDKCSVTALFTPVSAAQQKALSDLGVETEEDGIEFFRSLSLDSRGVCRINGRQTTLTLLREAAGLFCDIHEQEDAHALLDSSRHLFYLDAFAEDTFLHKRAEYKRLYEAYTEIKRRFGTLYSADRSEEKSRREFLEYQIRELEGARIRVGEEAELVEKKERLKNAKLLSDTTALVEASLSGEGGAYDRVMAAADALKKASEVVLDYAPLAEKLEEIGECISDVSRSVLREEGEGDPTAALDAIDTRLSLLRRLYSLYAPSEEELLQLLDAKKAELFAIDHAKEEARRLHAEALEARDAARVCALALRAERVRAAAILETEILESLKDLDMPAVRFEVRMTEREKISPDGLDDVEFYIGTNVGQPMMPLSKIASGGELSRILLALRCVLSRIDAIDTLVFDEIDTGVSGKSAAKIGSAMRRLGAERQVLAVTHSAQVASRAHAQVKVEKEIALGNTEAKIYPLSAEEREREIARILGGETSTETSLAGARELLSCQGK